MDKLSNKAKYIISALLIVAAVIMILVSIAISHVRPPENSGGDQQLPPGASEIVPAMKSGMRKDIYTVLVVGRDAVSGNTDTIMLVAFDAAQKKMNIMSIPRDTITNSNRTVKKINAAYASHGKKGKEKALQGLYEEVASVCGVYPNNYVFVTVDGFVDLIDALGGVEVDVPIDMVYNDPTQNLKINIKKGYQTLDGYDSMGFMRYRATYADGDLGRIKMQHNFIDALIQKMLKPATLTKVPELAQIVIDNVETDLSLGNSIWFAKQILEMDRERDIMMTMLPGSPKMYQGLSYYFPNEEEVLALINESFNPYNEPIEKLNLFKE